MKFKYNMLNFITAISFILAFLCLMFYYLTPYMYIPSMVFFEAAFIMLSIRLIKNYIKGQKELEERQETIVMELASGEDGETYVMQDETKNLKRKRKKIHQKFEKLMPSILTIIAAGLILYMIISSVIRLIKG